MKPAASRPLRCAPTTRTGDSQLLCGRQTLLHRRFQRQGVLGRGGIGQVEHAFDLVLQRDVAIKTLHPRTRRRAGTAAAEELRREARIGCLLEHPNILPVYELVEDREGNPTALVMRFVEGETLAERLRQLGPAIDNQLVLRPILEALIQVCDAVAYAHAQRVLHLDLKPENVMLDGSGHVFVLDWGEAARGTPDESGNLRPVSRELHAKGTPLYMAPEQFANDPAQLDQRTDVYALGGLLYQALSGRAPFQGVERARRGPRPPLTVPAIPLRVRTPLLVRLESLAMQALSEKRTRRPPSVAAFRDELRAIANQESFLLPLHFPAGAYIVREGEPADIAYILLEGECRVCRLVGEADVPVATIRAGETFGESAMLPGRQRTASVVASSPVTLLPFDRATIEQTLGRGWVATFLKSLVPRSNRSDPVPPW